MITLNAVRQYISDLEITADRNVYIGKMDAKKQMSVGVYGRKTSGDPYIALGGVNCGTYDIRPVSLLIHWNRSQIESEAAAYNLFERLKNADSLNIGGTHIDYLRLMVPEPQDIGTDDSGIYEYVIWFDLIYRKGE